MVIDGSNDDSQIVPGINYFIAISSGAIFILGGILQLFFGEIQGGKFTGDLLLGFSFLIPGLFAVLFGITNLTLIAVKNRREKKRILEEKFSYIKN
ncbi:MAG: hypothetical protein ACTSXO_00655 [Candidatus Heimdallarchaeota archaeon]|nr:MAG: hypothetical protein DRP02_05445 [Candidatus Gerdarchaeota archaeon]